MIYIIGLGASDINQLTIGVAEFLKKEFPIYLRTDQHPMIEYFENNNIKFQSFDYIYEKFDTFEEVYETIITTLIKQHDIEKNIIYAVPGHPCLAEYTVKELIKRVTDTKIIGGQSFLDNMFAALKIDPIEGFQLMDALKFDINKVDTTSHLFVPQVFDQLVASNLKLDLMEKYDDEHIICIVKRAGSIEEVLDYRPLYQLDYNFKLDNLITVYVPPILESNKK
jgi:tetrapyrrole methylase family protein/MazG family protein